jgi:hypothetical protein
MYVNHGSMGCLATAIPVKVLRGSESDEAVRVGEIGEDAHVIAILELAAGRHDDAQEVA